ncbi:prepilin-type N-terminal cleavage/methylation domain-containing protein [Dactylosporangium sp. NPDC051485]|uniref:prepilin-type N-terminal cleavage/methylation domain-containing protein n=1 Tax=Dactylosporangium sp. NPDC051485 TaxID=3154846 RepID=UPI0034350695
MSRDCRRADEGFSLVEVLTSLAIMGVVMTALTTFFISTTNTINKQRGLQIAIRYAHDGVEMVRSLPGPKLAQGRTAIDVANQFLTDRVPNLDLTALKDSMKPAVDSTLDPTTASANPPPPQLLPTIPETRTFDGTVFRRHWYLGTCVMDPKLSDMDPKLSDASCLLSSRVSNPMSFYRVVVAVTWQNSRACAGGECSYMTDTLISGSTSDPIFNPSVTVTPPLPDNPGNQTSEVTVAITALRLTASTAYPPITWSAENLPPGLSISDAGVVTGTPTVAGVYVVRMVVKDQAGTNDTSFNWTVNALPAVTQPANQTWDAGSAVSYTVPMTGGTAPMAWTATGLPAGLSIAPTTGVITGSSTATGAAAAATVKVAVTDTYGKTANATFQWNTKVAVQKPNATNPIALTKGTAYSGSVDAAGGSGGYTFSSPNLPPGLSMSPAGLITGTITGGTRYLVTINVTDSRGATNSTVVPVNVTVDSGLRITSPAASAPDRTGTKGTAIATQTATATDGTTPYTWSATNLPPGITLTTTNNNGVMTGTPTTSGSYEVTLKVTDRTGATSTFTFVWKIT